MPTANRRVKQIGKRGRMSGSWLKPNGTVRVFRTTKKTHSFRGDRPILLKKSRDKTGRVVNTFLDSRRTKRQR